MRIPTEISERAKSMRREPTPAERAMWRMLRGGQAGGLKFRRQQPIGPYIADFICFEARLVVECDGGQHADNPYDAARDAWFAAEGFTVLRFWNNEILDHPHGVIDRILAQARR